MTFEQGVITALKTSNKSKVSRITIIEYLVKLTDSFTVRLKSSDGSISGAMSHGIEIFRDGRIG